MKRLLALLTLHSLLLTVCAIAQTSTIEALTDATALADGDKLWMVDVSASGAARDVDATLSQLLDYVEASDATVTGSWDFTAGTITVNDADLPATLTRDSEWDTLAEINAATTDDDAVGLLDIDTFAELDALVADQTLLNAATGYTQAAANAAFQAILAEGAFTDGDKTKLDGIESGADVTDTANVTAAGALMDSEVTNLAAVKAFDPSAYESAGVAAADITDATATGQAAITAADASALRSTAGLGGIPYPMLQLYKRMVDMRIDDIDADSSNGFTNNRLDVNGITQANPALVTTGAYGTVDFQNGDYVIFEGITGMTEINGLVGVVSNKSSEGDTTFNVGIDTTTFTAFSNGGTITRLGSKRLLVYNTGDSFNTGKAAEMLGLGFAKQFSRRGIQFAPAVGPAPAKDGVMIAHYMDYDYSGGVTHYVKNSGGTNGRVATPDYTISLSGAYWSVPSGDTLDFYGYGDGLVDATRVEVFYVVDTGLGDFKIQTSGTSISSGFADALTGISTAGTKTMQKAVIRLDSADEIAVRIAATSGTVKILGCLIYRDDIPEVVCVNSGVSSLTPSLSYGALDDSVGEALLTELQPDLWTSCFADDGTEQPDALDDLAGWVSSAGQLQTRKTAVLVVGISPTSLTGGESSVNDATLAKCEELDFACFDTYRALGEADANLYDYGISRDGAHLSEEGSLIVAHLIASEYGLPSPLFASADLESVGSLGLDVFKRLRKNGSVAWLDDDGTEIFTINESGSIGGTAFNESAQAAASQPPLEGGFKMSGSSSYIDLGNIFDQDMTTDWSIDFWAFFKRPGSSVTMFSSRIATPRMNLSLSNIGSIVMTIDDGTNSAVITRPSGTIPTTRSLYHIAVVCDVSEADGLRLYINGNLQGSADPTSVGDLTHVNEMVFGAARNDGISAAAAMFANINLWEKALSESDIDELRFKGSHYHVYKNGGAATAGLYFGSDLDDFGTGAQILDWSGNGRDGVVSGATLY